MPADGLKRKKSTGKRPIQQLEKTHRGKAPNLDRESPDSLEEEEDHPHPKKRLHPNLKPPKPLPFAAIPVRPRPGPQSERPTTQQQKRKSKEEEEEDTVLKKKAKRSKEVTKVGPLQGTKEGKAIKRPGQEEGLKVEFCIFA